MSASRHMHNKVKKVMFLGHSSYLFNGQFGLERETLRVDENGRLAQTPHPFDDEHLSRDFCENQLEIITPVCESIGQMMHSLQQLDEKARNILAAQKESLWLYSNPPHIDCEAEIPIAHFEGSLSEKLDYRLHLERRYGKRIMLYSGIHFNFSFSEAFLRELFEKTHETSSYTDFRNGLYLRLLKQVSRCSWLLVLLTAASPVYDLSLDGDGKGGIGVDGYASMRSGERGYWNQFVPELDYSGLSAYADSIRHYIQKGALFSAGELYLPVRLKPAGANTLESLLQNGVDHIELRMFDLNPLEPLGIAQKDLEFAHLLLIYLLHAEDLAFTPQLQAEAIAHHKAAALYELGDVMIDGTAILEAANRILDSMSEFFEEEDVQHILAYEREKINGVRLCEAVRAQMEKRYEAGEKHV